MAPCPRNPSGYARSRKPTSTLCADSTPPLDQRSLPVVPLPQPPRSPTPLEKDGLLGDDSGQLAVALLDDTLAGIVAWRSIETGGPDRGCLEIGALLFPEHRGRGLGTAAQGLLVECLFATTLANRLQAITNVENLAEQRALERIGFRREGVMRGLAFDGGRWHDGALYARLRYDPA